MLNSPIQTANIANPHLHVCRCPGPDLEPGDVCDGVCLGGALPPVRAQDVPRAAPPGEVRPHLPRQQETHLQHQDQQGQHNTLGIVKQLLNIDTTYPLYSTYQYLCSAVHCMMYLLSM